MAKIQLVITDLDGTFLDNPDEMNADNVRAMHQCEAQGVAVRCVTARGYHNIKRLLAVGQWKGMCVTNNGAAIHDIETGKAVYRNTIEKEQVRQILTLCKQAEAVNLFASAGTFSVTCTEFPRQINARMSHVPKADPMQWPEEQRPVQIQTHSIDEMVEALGDDTELLCIHGKDGREFSGAFYRSIIQLGDFMLTSSHPGGFDIMAAGSTKREGAKRLASMMGIGAQNVMACGDLYNDVGMVKWDGVGVAMGDGCEELKRVADYVSVPHDAGGVADAMRKYVLQA